MWYLKKEDTQQMFDEIVEKFGKESFFAYTFFGLVDAEVSDRLLIDFYDECMDI